MDHAVDKKLKQCKSIYDDLKTSYKKTRGGTLGTNRTRQMQTKDTGVKRYSFKKDNSKLKVKQTKVTKADQSLLDETYF